MANAKRQISIFVNGQQVEATAKNIAAAYRKASNELANMVVGSEDYIKKLEEVKGLNSELQAHKKALSGIAEGYTLTKAGVDKFVGVAAGAFAVEKIFAFGRELFNTAGKMELLAKKAQTVFGESLPQITQEAEKNAEAMGLTTQEYISSAAAIQDLLVPMGFQRKEAAEISAQLVNLSGALSEWSGGQRSAEEVTQILSAALLGERDSLKGLGIDLKQSEIDSELAARGLSNLAGESKKQAEAAVTLDLIMRKSVDAQDAFAKGTGGIVRTQAELTAKIKEITDKISTALIPVFGALVSIVGRVVDNVSHLFTGYGQVDKAQNTLIDSTRRTQAEFNAEIKILTEGNFSQAERARLIKEINTKYGQYLPNLISERASIDKIREAQQAANRVFAQKILYLAFEDKIQEATKKSAQAANVAYESEKRRQDLLNKADFQDNSGLERITQQQIALLGTLRQEAVKTVEETPDRVAQIKKIYDGLAKELGSTLSELETKFKEKAPAPELEKAKEKKGEKPLTPEEEKEIIKRFKERQEAIQNLQALVTQTTQTTQAEFAKKQQAEFETLASTNEAKLNLDLNYEQEKADAQEQIRQTLLTDQEAEIESLNLHYQYLLQIADRYGIDRTALEKQHREKLQTISDKYDKEGAQKAYDANQARLKVLGDSFTALGDLVTATANVFADESEQSAAISKVATLAKIAFDTAAAISSLVASSEANPANAVTFGGAGIAQYAAGIIRILANIAQARKILSGAPKVVHQKFEGGAVVPVTGAQDGRTYHAAPIGAPGTGLLPSFPVLIDSRATGGHILASERGAEYFVSASDLRNPRVADHVRMIDTITRSRVSQFAEGGLNAAQPGGAGATTAAEIDPAIIINNTVAIQALVQVLQQGILAIVPDITITDIAKRLKTLNTASGGFFS